MNKQALKAHLWQNLLSKEIRKKAAQRFTWKIPEQNSISNNKKHPLVISIILSYTLCCTKQKLLPNFNIITQKLKIKNGIRSRATTAPRTRWACDFPLLSILQNCSEPNFAFFFFPPSPRSRVTILKCSLQSKICLYGDSAFSRYWQSWC